MAYWLVAGRLASWGRTPGGQGSNLVYQAGLLQAWLLQVCLQAWTEYGRRRRGDKEDGSMTVDLEDDWTGPHLDADLTQGLCHGGGVKVILSQVEAAAAN